MRTSSWCGLGLALVLGCGEAGGEPPRGGPTTEGPAPVDLATEAAPTTQAPPPVAEPPREVLPGDGEPHDRLGPVSARWLGTDEIIGGVAIASHVVRVTTSDGVAHTEVEQVLANDSTRSLEAQVTLPIPSDAAVTRLALDVGGRLEEGAVVARRAGDRVRGLVVGLTSAETLRVRDPAVLELQPGGAATVRVFPVPAQGRRRVVVAYDEVLRAGPSGDAWIRVPLAFLDHEGAAARVEVVVDGVTVVDAARPDGLVDLEVPATKKRPAVVTARDAEGDVVLARAVAEADDETAAFAGDLAIVLDVSSAQTEATIALQRALVRAIVGDLSDDEGLVILACDTACASFPERGLAGGASRGAGLDRFLDGLDPGGAYDLGAALEAAEARLAAGPSQVLLLSSGTPTSGTLDIASVIGAARIALDGRDVRAVGVGARVDLPTLHALGAAVGGTVDLLAASPVDATPDVLARVRRVPIGRAPGSMLPSGFEVASRVSQPARAGEEVVVLAHGRFAAASSDAAVAPTLARLWARATIEARRAEGARPDVLASLAHAHGVATLETSLSVLVGAEYGAQVGLGSAQPAEVWGSDLRATQARRPRVHVCYCSVSGRLPPESVQRVVRLNFGRFRGCYQDALRRRPSVAGKISTRFVIDRAGGVREAATSSSDTDDGELDACVRRAFLAMSFPVPEGGVVHVEYPIAFAPDDAARSADEEPMGLALPKPRAAFGSFALGDPWPRNTTLRPQAPPPQAPNAPLVLHQPGDDGWLDPSLHAEPIEQLMQRSMSDRASRPAARRLVRGLLSRGQRERALTEAAAWVRREASSAQARELYAEALVATGDARGAARALSSAAALDARSRRRQRAAAVAWAALGDASRACSHVNAAASLGEPLSAETDTCDAGRAPALREPAGFSIDAGVALDAAVVLTPEGRVLSALTPGGPELVAGTYRTVATREDAVGTVTVSALGVAFTADLAARAGATSVTSQVWASRPDRAAPKVVVASLR